MVGERGLTLSGGQRQRIAIARALIAEPRILILDDATSSVDATTEEAIKEGLREAMAGRTTFVVAHRLSTISLADEIVVMDAGRIVDRGSHEELLERCPLYAEIAEFGLRGRALPAARPGGARGAGQAMSEAKRDPETQGSDVAEETEDQANQPGRLAGTALMLRDIWRLLRGEDERARKGRWLLSLLRHLPAPGDPDDDRAADRHRGRAGAAVPGRQGDRQRHPGGQRERPDGHRRDLHRLGGDLLGGLYAQTFLVGWVGQRALQDLRERIYIHIQKMSIGFFTRRKRGS